MFTYTENNPVMNIDPSGYCIADTEGGTVNSEWRPKCSSPYDNMYNAWYVHPMYYNENLYDLVQEFGPYEYNGPSYFWYYMGGMVGGAAIGIIGYFTGGLGWMIGGVAVTLAGGGLVIHETYLRGDPDVYTLDIHYNERHDVTRVTVNFYETNQSDGWGLDYDWVGYATFYISGKATASETDEIFDQYN